MGDIGKIIKTQNQLTQSIEDNTELMKKEQIKLDFKLKQVKDFLNIKQGLFHWYNPWFTSKRRDSISLTYTKINRLLFGNYVFYQYICE